MKIALLATKINRHTGEVTDNEVKHTKVINEDEFYKPLVEVLGSDFLKQFEGGAKVGQGSQRNERPT